MRLGHQRRMGGPDSFRHFDVVLTSDLAGGLAPFRNGVVAINFHKWDGDAVPLPPKGPIWAFVDRVLPGIDGLETCRRLRCDPVTARAHITMVLEGTDPEDRRRALRSGADDTIAGPVDRARVLDRVLADCLRETANGAACAPAGGDLTIDVAAFQARWLGKPIALMPNEFRLLRFFAEHPGRVFTRSQLISALGKQDPPLDERTVDVWIGRLRRALRTAGAGDPLRTVRSLGYVFDAV